MVWFFWLEVADLSGLKDFAFAAYYTYNYNERVKSPTPPNSNSSSAEAIFDQEIPSRKYHCSANYALTDNLIAFPVSP